MYFANLPILVSFPVITFVLGSLDPEMAEIHRILRDACNRNPGRMVVLEPAASREGAYALDLEPAVGQVWIEAAPKSCPDAVTCPDCAGTGEARGGNCSTCGGHRVLSRREQMLMVGAVVIDHHNIGDVLSGTPAFAASSVGRVIALLAALGVSAEGMETGMVVAQVADNMPMSGGLVYNETLETWFVSSQGWVYAVSPGLVMVGEADHDFPKFMRGELTTPKKRAVEFHAARSGVTPSEVEEVLALVSELPVVDGHFDARGCAELVPATVIGGKPQDGTGGRLGRALFAAVGALEMPLINWGAQPVSPKGRNVAVLGPTTADSVALLARIGAIGIYPANPIPGRVMGGYIPV